MTEVVPADIAPELVHVNGKWPVWMAPHRAARPEWHTPPYWEGPRLDAMHDVIDSFVVTVPPVVWDVGAEEGDMPALYATWGCDVVLIEPNPKVWPCIRYHWTANQLADPVGSYVGLVGSVPNTIDTVSYELASAWPTCSNGPMYPAHGFHHLDDYEATDPTSTLDLLAQDRLEPDVVTVDIEGGEGLMLAGAHHMLEVIRPVWFISVHPQFMWDLYRQNADRDVHQVMARFGYTGTLIDNQHEEHWMYTP